MTPEEFRRAERRLEIGIRAFWVGIVLYAIFVVYILTRGVIW